MKPLVLYHKIYRSHPWHGVYIGDEAPEITTVYIEIVPTDTVKYELDKPTGLLRIDRPQKYSNCCPALYGFLPQTYCAERVGNHCKEKTQQLDIQGDGDPLDICVFAERPIARGDLILEAIPIGGFRMIDGMEADDKIIAVLKKDLVYGKIRDIADCPAALINRLRHYFLTYKDYPSNVPGGKSGRRRAVEIVDSYDHVEAHEIIQLARLDYQTHFAEIYQTMEGLREEER